MERTIAHLRSLGYYVDDLIVDAVAIGVPQHRRRHLVVASRERHPDLRTAMGGFASPERCVDWAIGDLARTPQGGALDGTGLPSAKSRERIDYLFKHRLYGSPDEHRPDCHRLKPHSYKSVYGRLRQIRQLRRSRADSLAWAKGGIYTRVSGERLRRTRRAIAVDSRLLQLQRCLETYRDG